MLFRSFLVFLIIALMALSMPTGPAWAEMADARARETETSLARALESARKELRNETRRMERESRARQRRIKQLEARKNALAQKSGDLLLSLPRLQKKLAALNEREKKLKDELNRLTREENRLAKMVPDGITRARGHISTLVPSSARGQQVRDLAQLESTLQSGTSGFLAAAAYIAFLDVLMKESRSCEVYQCRLRTAPGRLERVKLVRMGHFAAAYITAGGRTGLALRSPSGPGIRWTEKVRGAARNSILKATHAVSEGRPGPVLFPLDVTRSITRQTRYARESYWNRLKAGGPMMIPLAAVALVAALLVFERLWFFGREGRASWQHAAKVIEMTREARFDDAEQYCEQHRGPVVRAMKACLSHRHLGLVAMEDSIEEAMLHELPRSERFLSALAVLATVAPLLGLLGTVTGMIHTFDMITVHGTSNPRLMAGGISEALITTATGLVIAIPILLIHSFLTGKMEGLLADTERFAASLLVLLREHVDTSTGMPESGEAGKAAIQSATDNHGNNAGNEPTDDHDKRGRPEEKPS